MNYAVRGVVPGFRAWTDSTGRGVLKTVVPGGVLDRAVAGLLPEAKFRCLQRVVFPAAVVAELPGAAAAGSDGAILTSDGCLVLESIARLFVSSHLHAVWDDAVKSTAVSGRLGVATCHGSTNFAHVLADLVARVWQIRRAGREPDAWIVPAERPQWLDELLTIIGIPPSSRLGVQPGEQIRADCLVVATASGFAPTTAVWVRHAISDLIGSPKSATRRILVRRTKATRRRWLQESEAIQALAKWEVEPIVFEELPVDKQLEISRSANLIIGAHGAGLAHVICAPSGGRLIEVADSRVAHCDYWGLAAIAEWQYVRTPAKPSSVRCPDNLNIEDFEQPIDSVLEILRST